MRIILLIALSLIVSCTTTSSFNDTAFAYEYNAELVQQKPIKNVVLAPMSLGAPVRTYLQDAERKTRNMVKDYLESNGYNVLPNYQFENARKQAARTYGDFYDPSTGKIDTNAWRATMVLIGEKLRTETNADAVIFADLIEHDVQHTPSLTHYARWYGVTRKPHLIGAGSGVPVDFNWSQPIKAASLMVTIYNMDLVRVFTSRGGLDTLEGVDTKRANPTFKRVKKLLKYDSHIEEGIELAFHPLIKMDNYPGQASKEK